MSKKSNRAIIGALLGGSISVLAMSSSAWAQQASETPQSEAEAQGDIVVTATRRSEAISKVPISMAAFSQENLDQRGIRNIQDVINQTPGVDLSRTGAAGSAGQNRLIIRGIDSNAGAATSAIYIDDTPVQARNSSLNYNGSTVPFVFDIDRVEVLRGPQGTLFGASSQGGAIRFITPTPSLTSYSAYGRASVNTVKGGDVGYEIGGAVGGPIVQDVLGFRASAYYRRDGGWIDRQSWLDPNVRQSNVNSSKAFVGRAALRFEPNDWLAVSPSIYFQDLQFRDQTPLWLQCPATTGSPLNPGMNPCPRGAADLESGRLISYSPAAQPSKDRFVLPAIKAEIDLGGATITSVTSWFNRNVQDVNDATQTNARVFFGTGTLTANNYLFPISANAPITIGQQYPNIKQRNFTQEVRLSGDLRNDTIRYTLGAYYARGQVTSDLPITLPTYRELYLTRFRVPAPAARFMVGDAIYYGQENTIEREISAFANVDFKFIDRLTLSLGGRISRNKVEFDIMERGVSYAATGGVARVTGVQKSTPFLPKASLSFQATQNALYYASYAEGYRVGGVNKTVPSTCNAETAQLGISPATFDPDRTHSYEVGTKNRLFGGALQYEVSAYYVKWKNIQQQLRLNCAFSLVSNTGSATSKGFDASITVKPNRDLSLNASIGYVDAVYDQTIAIGTAPFTIEGQTLGATPWTVNLSGEYKVPLGDDLNPFIRVQYNYKAANRGLFLYQIPASTIYDPGRRYNDDFGTVDMRVGVDIGRVNLSLYGENMFNKLSVLSWTPAYPRSTLVKGTTNKPRTIGLQIIARY